MFITITLPKKEVKNIYKLIIIKMKWKKTLILLTVVLGTLTGGAYAMYWQWGWNWGYMWMWHWFGGGLSTAQREKLQSMSMEDRMDYMQKLRWENWDMDDMMWDNHDDNDMDDVKWSNQDDNDMDDMQNLMWGNGGAWQLMQNVTTNAQKYVNQNKIEQYKWIIENKYAKKINSYTQSQLQSKITKVNDLLTKIVNGSYPEITKALYTNVLFALKVSLVSRLKNKTTNTSADSIINSIFGN